MENVYICQIFFLCSGDHWLNQDSLKILKQENFNEKSYSC